jgi:hypothetical protein
MFARPFESLFPAEKKRPFVSQHTKSRMKHEVSAV